MPEIEQPQFDELAVGSLQDLDEYGEAIIEDRILNAAAGAAAVVASYWGTLADNEIPPRECTKLTRQWMEIAAWGGD